MNLPQLRVFNFDVIRGFMPLGVAQEKIKQKIKDVDSDSWLYAVRRCSKEIQNNYAVFLHL